jgi:hypothetical protein
MRRFFTTEDSLKIHHRPLIAHRLHTRCARSLYGGRSRVIPVCLRRRYRRSETIVRIISSAGSSCDIVTYSGQICAENRRYFGAALGKPVFHRAGVRAQVPGKGSE